MIDGIWARHLGLAAVGFGLIGAAVYYLMMTVTLAHLKDVSGHVPFDMRPFGYGPADAAALLEGLGAEGRSYYLKRQIPLDIAYPALLALTLISAIRRFGHSMANNSLVRIGVILSVGVVVCDYSENICIVAMILGWPDTFTALVYASSVATVAKSILTTAAVTVVMLMGALSARHRLRFAS